MEESKKRKILFLGASHTQLAPLRYAKMMGYEVFTCDNRPENPGHSMAVESFNVSTTDIDGVLELARRLQVDGVVAYASDPAALTAAEVSSRLGLPGQNVESVKIMTDKTLWREFLEKAGFNVPKSYKVYDAQQAKEIIRDQKSGFLLKPVDSSGSKGITKLSSSSSESELENAVLHAFNYSRKNYLILEELVERDGPQVAGDGFVVDGELVHVCWGDENFDEELNGLVPVGQTFPTTQTKDRVDYARQECNRLVRALDLKTGPLNFDFIFDKSGELFILELGPRNGGCRIPEIAKLATGVDMISATVEQSIGSKIEIEGGEAIVGKWATFMFHAQSNGTFRDLRLSREVASQIIDLDIWIPEGSQINKYVGSDDAVGSSLLRLTEGQNTENLMRTLCGCLVQEL